MFDQKPTTIIVATRRAAEILPHLAGGLAMHAA
jgi:hypothetical protein